jgi:hypothetical protein
MKISVNDHDSLTKDDHIGSIEIPSDIMQRILRAPLGWKGEALLPLADNGQHVVGRDGRLSCIALKASVFQSRVKPRLLHINVVSFSCMSYEVSLASTQNS